MRRRLAPWALLFLVTPAFADTVYLKSGRAFEGVVATPVGQTVRISIEGGEITLPASQITHIETGASALAEYRSRRSRLDASDPQAASAWLELARWARAAGLVASSREAALTAARLDPGLEGVAPLLREQGYVHDPEVDAWVPYTAYQASRGLVHEAGEWLPRTEVEARWHARQEEAAAQRHEARLERLSRTVELAAIAQIAAAQRPPEPQPVLGYPVAVFPGFVFHRDRHPRSSPPPSGTLEPVDYSALANRLPGSNIPLRPTPPPPRHNSFSPPR